MICEKCQAEVLVSDWPFCPHGRGKSNVIDDEIDLVMDHIEPGRRVRSKTELRKVLNDHRSDMFPHGARLKEDGWVGVHDQHLKQWVAIPSMVSQEKRREDMAYFLGLTLEEFDRQFPA